MYRGSHNPTWGNYNSSGPLAANRLYVLRKVTKVTLSNSELEYSYWFIYSGVMTLRNGYLST